MPTYISLLNYTEQGISKIKESPSRLDAARALFKQHGSELKAFYLTMGGMDAVAIVEAPNDETVAKVLLTLGSKGNVRTTTSRAFTEEEYRKVVGSLP
ncbi:MAG TPA: GYD domain-containing protein [Acidobacteriota bacterium]|nr:GYD domain-containing protein [Acidobacteriota bacterium]